MRINALKHSTLALFVAVGCLQLCLQLPVESIAAQQTSEAQTVTNKLLRLCMARDEGLIGTNAFVVEAKEMHLHIELPTLLELRDHKITTQTLVLLSKCADLEGIALKKTNEANLPTPPANSGSSSKSVAGKEPISKGDEASAVKPAATSSAFMNLAHLSSGASFQNPYTVTYDSKKSTSTLQKNGNEVAAYLDFSLINLSVLYTNISTMKNEVFGGELLNFWEETPDFSMQIGFMFGNSSGPTNYSASTIVGSGDFYTQASLGLPFWRRFTNSVHHQLTLELAGGAITDSDFVSVYPNVFLGLGYQLGFKAFAEHSPGLLTARFGAGRILVPTAQDLDIPTAVTGMSGLF